MILLATYYGRNEIAQSLLAHGAPLNLFEASAVGAPDRVQELVTAQPYRIESFAVDGFTALGLAAFFGHADIVEFHLIRGADPNIASKNPRRVAPLNSAVAGQHLEIAKTLIAHKANVNAKQAGGFVPLHSAAQNGQIKMIELLLANGADVNAKGDDGKTALMFAIESKHDDAANLLRQRGAN
jgi:ankyrin repeat protein